MPTLAGALVAVISDGTAVLGLGDIGPAAALPVMEGKAAMFSQFAGINAIPIVLGTTDPDEIVDTVVRLAPSFGGINLEDISSPRCFEIEARLRERLDIPVFHDDQHGTAIVVLAALRNAAKVTGRELPAASCGVRCRCGRRRMHQDPPCGRYRRHRGCGFPRHAASRPAPTHPGEVRARPDHQPAGLHGSLHDALAGADVFLGLSAGSVRSRIRRPDGR